MFDDWFETLHGSDTLEPGVVVGDTGSERLRPALGAVRQLPHATPTGHRRALTQREVPGHVAPLDRQLDRRRRISSDGDATDVTEMVLDEANYSAGFGRRSGC